MMQFAVWTNTTLTAVQTSNLDWYIFHHSTHPAQWIWPEVVIGVVAQIAIWGSYWRYRRSVRMNKPVD